MTVKVIDPKNLPAKFPISLTVVTYLLLDKFHAPAWLYGVYVIVFLALWILVISKISMQRYIEIFEKPKEIQEQEEIDKITKETKDFLKELNKRSNKSTAK